MRLTLRTLLAYLDDTLPPTQALQIGKKVAESEIAQQIIERIKQVLAEQEAAPPVVGGKHSEPNLIAEYLDNTLSGDSLAQLEEIVLNSDLLLSEVAACHQILTLFQGQPASVPALAKKRMYGIAKKQDAAAPKAAPAKAKKKAVARLDDDDEEYEMPELPAFLRDDRRRRVISSVLIGGLLALIGFGIFKMWPSGHHAGPTEVVVATVPEDKGTTSTTQPEKPPATQPEKPPDKITPPEKPPEKPEVIPPPEKQPDSKVAIDKAPSNRPSTERREGIGRQIASTGGPTPILLRRMPDTEQWKNLPREGPIATTDHLVALPGYRSDVQLESGVLATLAGNLNPPEDPVSFPAFESEVVFHVPPAGFDADLTLQRGRLLLVNNKPQGEAHVRVRFVEEIWDLTLKERQAMAGLEFAGGYPPDVPFDKTGKVSEGPWFHLRLYCFRGNTDLKVGYRELSLPEKSYFPWNSRDQLPTGPTPATPQTWVDSKMPNSAFHRDLKVPLDELTTRLQNKPVDIALAELRKEPKTASKYLAVRCFGAIDAITELLDILASDSDAPGRYFAMFTLRQWIGWKKSNELVLYNTMHQKMKTYRPQQAEVVLELLHNFSQKDLENPETYEKLIANLNDPKLAIRQLSHWWLWVLIPDGRSIKYDPAGDKESLTRAQFDYRKLVPEGKIPAPPKTKPK